MVVYSHTLHFLFSQCLLGSAQHLCRANCQFALHSPDLVKRYRALAAGKQAPGTVQADDWVLIPFLGPNYTMSGADAQGGWRMDIGCWVFDIGHWVMPTEARPGGRWAGVGSIQTFFPGNDYRPFPRGRPFVVGAVSWDRVMGRGGGGARYKVFVRNNYVNCRTLLVH
jgi:hypothetical protein